MAHFSSSLVLKMNRPALPKTWKTFLFSALTFASSSKPFRKRRVVHICQIIWIMRHCEWYFNTVQYSCLKIFLKYFFKYWKIGNLQHSCFCSNVLRFLQLFSMESKSCCLAPLCTVVLEMMWTPQLFLQLFLRVSWLCVLITFQVVETGGGSWYLFEEWNVFCRF